MQIFLAGPRSVGSSAQMARPLPLDGGAAVSRGLSPGGEAPTASVAGASGPARS